MSPLVVSIVLRELIALSGRYRPYRHLSSYPRVPVPRTRASGRQPGIPLVLPRLQGRPARLDHLSALLGEIGVPVGAARSAAIQ